MPKYVIEREIPGAGNLSPQDLQAVRRNPARSCKTSVRRFSGCRVTLPETRSPVYIAPSEDMIRARAAERLSCESFLKSSR